MQLIISLRPWVPLRLSMLLCLVACKKATWQRRQQQQQLVILKAARQNLKDNNLSSAETDKRPARPASGVEWQLWKWELLKGWAKAATKKIPKTTTIIYSQKFKATSLSFMQKHHFFPSKFTRPPTLGSPCSCACIFWVVSSRQLRACRCGVRECVWCVYVPCTLFYGNSLTRPHQSFAAIFPYTRPTPERYLPCCVVCVHVCVSGRVSEAILLCVFMSVFEFHTKFSTPSAEDIKTYRPPRPRTLKTWAKPLLIASNPPPIQAGVELSWSFWGKENGDFAAGGETNRNFEHVLKVAL